MTFPMAASNLGASLTLVNHIALFAEDQSRYLATCPPKEAAKIITQAHVAGVNVIRIGTVTDDPLIAVADTVTLPLADLRTAHEGWFPRFMASNA
jgi:phosphoribosylformylglycinamidine synthase subunit PurL